MIPSHAVFLRKLSQSGRKLTMQYKTEGRTRKLRKKARRSSRRCKDRRAGIKRTVMGKPSRRTRRALGWTPSARQTLPRPPSCFVPGSPLTEEGKRIAGKQPARPGDAARALGRSSRLGARGSALSHATSEQQGGGSAGPRASFPRQVRRPLSECPSSPARR